MTDHHRPCLCTWQLYGHSGTSCVQVQRAPSKAESSCCRRGASHLHAERLTTAALRIAAPAHATQMHPQMRLYMYSQSLTKQADSPISGTAKGEMLDLDNLIWLQTGISDGWHNASQGFWLEVQKDVDCTPTLSSTRRENMLSWYEIPWQKLHGARTSCLVALCTCQEGQSDRWTLLHLSYLLSQK